ncbi:hypothetical protein M0811_09372 [Anaeramoeba ignava]|uniref:PAS domain-containing protein n=1 Tax=Anaeramoeba ignava TaxID=1746090 RepID=A0A9Q0LIZ9_ANAIG|nr:hypothetical protein M0811_09372 [Anaeramoeba ignava]
MKTFSNKKQQNNYIKQLHLSEKSLILLNQNRQIIEINENAIKLFGFEDINNLQNSRLSNFCPRFQNHMEMLSEVALIMITTKSFEPPNECDFQFQFIRSGNSKFWAQVHLCPLKILEENFVELQIQEIQPLEKFAQETNSDWSEAVDILSTSSTLLGQIEKFISSDDDMRNFPQEKFTQSIKSSSPFEKENQINSKKENQEQFPLEFFEEKQENILQNDSENLLKQEALFNLDNSEEFNENQENFEKNNSKNNVINNINNNNKSNENVNNTNTENIQISPNQPNQNELFKPTTFTNENFDNFENFGNFPNYLLNLQNSVNLHSFPSTLTSSALKYLVHSISDKNILFENMQNYPSFLQHSFQKSYSENSVLNKNENPSFIFQKMDQHPLLNTKLIDSKHQQIIDLIQDLEKQSKFFPQEQQEMIHNYLQAIADSSLFSFQEIKNQIILLIDQINSNRKYNQQEYSTLKGIVSQNSQSVKNNQDLLKKLEEENLFLKNQLKQILLIGKKATDINKKIIEEMNHLKKI